jgi:hypothetical protein
VARSRCGMWLDPWPRHDEDRVLGLGCGEERKSLSTVVARTRYCAVRCQCLKRSKGTACGRVCHVIHLSPAEGGLASRSCFTVAVEKHMADPVVVSHCSGHQDPSNSLGCSLIHALILRLVASTGHLLLGLKPTSSAGVVERFSNVCPSVPRRTLLRDRS